MENDNGIQRIDGENVSELLNRVSQLQGQLSNLEQDFKLRIDAKDEKITELEAYIKILEKIAGEEKVTEARREREEEKKKEDNEKKGVLAAFK